MSKDGTDDEDPPYEVGYKKPPVKSRFVKGRSGNPSGRKRKSPSTLSDVVLRAGSKLVTVIVEGKPTRMSAIDAMMQNFFIRTTAKPTARDVKLATDLYRNDAAHALETLTTATRQIIEIQFIDGDGMPIEELNNLHNGPKKERS